MPLEASMVHQAFRANGEHFPICFGSDVDLELAVQGAWNPQGIEANAVAHSPRLGIECTTFSNALKLMLVQFSFDCDYVKQFSGRLAKDIQKGPRAGAVL